MSHRKGDVVSFQYDTTTLVGTIEAVHSAGDLYAYDIRDEGGTLRRGIIEEDIGSRRKVDKGTKPRRFAQLSTCYIGNGDHMVYAVADDGTAWELKYDGPSKTQYWAQLVELPKG
jgi:hypothetical protein